MSKRQNRKYGISRRLGMNLWGRETDPYVKKNYPPGMHTSSGYKKLTDYGVQLQAKQALKKYYANITEKQFRKIYEEAVRRKGDSSENMVGLLESRLDAFVFRSGLAPTPFAARQVVNHKHVSVNGRTVNIASYVLKPNDVVEVREKSKNIAVIQESFNSNKRPAPDYISIDTHALSAKYLRVPVLADIPYPNTMDVHLIIEFYSK